MVCTSCGTGPNDVRDNRCRASSKPIAWSARTKRGTDTKAAAVAAPPRKRRRSRRTLIAEVFPERGRRHALRPQTTTIRPIVSLLRRTASAGRTTGASRAAWAARTARTTDAEIALGQDIVHALALLRRQMLVHLENTVQIGLLLLATQLRDLVDEQVELGEVDRLLLQHVAGLLAQQLDLMNALAALGGVLLEPVAHCLALAVVELEVVHHHFDRSLPATQRRTRHMLAEWRRDPAPVDETGKNEAVEQQRQAEQ